jgi:hypothetical protein
MANELARQLLAENEMQQHLAAFSNELHNFDDSTAYNPGAYVQTYSVRFMRLSDPNGGELTSRDKAISFQLKLSIHA